MDGRTVRKMTDTDNNTDGHLTHVIRSTLRSRPKYIHCKRDHGKVLNRMYGEGDSRGETTNPGLPESMTVKPYSTNVKQ